MECRDSLGAHCSYKGQVIKVAVGGVWGEGKVRLVHKRQSGVKDYTTVFDCDT